jgi:hypothetical protein
MNFVRIPGEDLINLDQVLYISPVMEIKHWFGSTEYTIEIVFVNGTTLKYTHIDRLVIEEVEEMIRGAVL